MAAPDWPPSSNLFPTLPEGSHMGGFSIIDDSTVAICTSAASLAALLPDYALYVRGLSGSLSLPENILGALSCQFSANDWEATRHCVSYAPPSSAEVRAARESLSKARPNEARRLMAVTISSASTDFSVFDDGLSRRRTKLVDGSRVPFLLNIAVNAKTHRAFIPAQCSIDDVVCELLAVIPDTLNSGTVVVSTPHGSMVISVLEFFQRVAALMQQFRNNIACPSSEDAPLLAVSVMRPCHV